MDDNVYNCHDPEASYTFNSCSSPEAGDALIGKGCYFSEGRSQYLPCGKICNDVEKGSLDEEHCMRTIGCQTYLADFCNSNENEESTLFMPYGTRALLASVVVMVIIAVIIGICLYRRRSRKIRKYRIASRPQQTEPGGIEDEPANEPNDPSYHPRYSEPLLAADTITSPEMVEGESSAQGCQRAPEET